MKCKHEYVDMKDGSRDKFCVKCSKKFMQAAICLPNASATPSIIRETVIINMGGHIGSVDVYKDKLEAEVNKAFTKQFDIGLRG